MLPYYSSSLTSISLILLIISIPLSIGEISKPGFSGTTSNSNGIVTVVEVELLELEEVVLVLDELVELVEIVVITLLYPEATKEENIGID